MKTSKDKVFMRDFISSIQESEYANALEALHKIVDEKIKARISKASSTSES